MRGNHKKHTQAQGHMLFLSLFPLHIYCFLLTCSCTRTHAHRLTHIHTLHIYCFLLTCSCTRTHAHRLTRIHTHAYKPTTRVSAQRQLAQREGERQKAQLQKLQQDLKQREEQRLQVRNAFHVTSCLLWLHGLRPRLCCTNILR
jgi:hypothetical protein